MKINLKWIILCISALYSLYSYAQEPVEVTTDEPNKLVIVSKDKAGNEVIRILDESKATKFNEHNTPRFLLTSRSNNFALGVGGYLRADLAYDFKCIVNDASFHTAHISLP